MAKQQKRNVKQRPQLKREQPRKDSDSKRVNFDNERIEKVVKAIKTMNDFVWYNKNPEMIQAAGSLPMGQVLGTKLSPSIPMSVPGIMAIGWSPNFGTPDGDQAINSAKNFIYSYVVHANSRNYTYDPADLMQMVIAGIDFFADLAMPIRAYGVYQNFDANNIYTPQAILDALGFSYTDFQENAAQILFDINDLIAQSRQIWIPSVMPLVNRWYWMSSNIYQDANDPKGQMYAFVKKTCYIYSPDKYTTGGSLIRLKNPDDITKDFDPYANSYKWSTWKAALQQKLNALLDIQDRGIMMGDILNAYGSDKIFSLQNMPSDYKVYPVYEQEVLSQIENIRCCTQRPAGLLQTPDGSLRTIWTEQATGYLVDPAAMGMSKSAVVNFHHGGIPTAEEITIATRLTTVGGVFNAKSGYVEDRTTNTGIDPTLSELWIPTAAGSEIVSHISIYQFKENDTGRNPTKIDLKTLTTTINSTSDTISTNEYMNLGWLSSFDWHPFVYILRPWGDTTALSDVRISIPYGANPQEFVAAFGDYNNFSITDENLVRLHRACLYSLFNVPSNI